MKYLKLKQRGGMEDYESITGILKLDGEDGSVFIGDIINGRKEGPGKVTYNNEDELIGIFKDDKLIYGTMIYKTGVFKGTYTGDFKNSLPHGKGTMKYTDGDEYTGSWENGHPHGKGIMKYTNGDEYTGYWEKGNPHGKGFMFYKNENENNNVNEENENNNQNESWYGGDWVDGHQHGQGHTTYFDEEVGGIITYEGEWIMGQPNGKGKIIYADGTVRHKGDYVDGVLQLEKVSQENYVSPELRRFKSQH